LIINQKFTTRYKVKAKNRSRLAFVYMLNRLVLGFVDWGYFKRSHLAIKVVLSKKFNGLGRIFYMVLVDGKTVFHICD